MPSIKLLKRAEIELTDSCQWYEKQQKGLSSNLRIAIKKSLTAISLNPLIFEKRFDTELRFALVHKFPYVIVYWYDEKLDTIFVTSIFIQNEIPKLLKMDKPTDLSVFLNGKTEHTLSLFNHFTSEYQKLAPVTIHPAKTMIGIANSHRRVAWVTQLGKNFVHVVFPFKQAYPDNSCFQKIAQVPDDNKQYNHHFRMYAIEDVNEEVLKFMQMAYEDR